ncbi:hypothetical protein L917_08997 [Phytophthora nicotianae]|uniref:Uncharacterized protein n=1 Tax=Phytophthora nicotianae TaxID=4792 RepID=W2NEA2_PHYNI|nr:hypothetical protein L917_08997 [Phytophthora nicotianae]ETM46039.1 hypothetical protein L914_09017 [Phytophthora nicotianae]
MTPPMMAGNKAHPENIENSELGHNDAMLLTASGRTFWANPKGRLERKI